MAKIKKITPPTRPESGKVSHVKSRRDDSWQNVITGIGTSQDKRLGNQVLWDARTPDFYEQAYAGSSLMARIVDTIPVDALRKWVDWTGVEKEEEKLINDRCQQLDVRGAFQRAWIWARCFGGGCVYIATDTDAPSTPLQKGEKVIGLRDLSRWDLRILTTDVEYDFGSPNWGMPKLYYLNVQMGAQFKGYPIHWTRMIRFDGQLVPRRTFIRNNYWHDSVLNRTYNAVRNYESSNDAAAMILQDFNVDVYSLKNLANYVAAGKEDIVKKRIEMMSYSKSVIRAMILDSDDETYENKGRQLTGVPELLRQQANRLVADTDIPHTKLLGESPDGSNATGNSTSQSWYDFLSSEQENYARPKLKRLAEVLFPDFPELDFKWNPLRVLDETEIAELRSKQASTDVAYISAGVLDPAEVTESRFGGDAYSIETVIDKDSRDVGLISSGTSSYPEEEGNAIDPINPEGQPQEGELPSQAVPDKQVEDTALNGAQVSSMVEIVQSVAASQLPRDSAVQIIIHAFQLDQAAAERILGSAGKGFEIKSDSETPESVETGAESDAYELRNEEIPQTDKMRPKDKAVISQTMSDPMRDPRTELTKGPGIPNKPRTILPTRGTGVTANSGYDFKKDPLIEGDKE